MCSARSLSASRSRLRSPRREEAASPTRWWRWWGACGPPGGDMSHVETWRQCDEWWCREMLNENTDPQIIMRTTLRELIVYWWGTIATGDCSWNICTNKSPRWIHETMLQLLSSDRDLQFQQKAGSLTTANIHNENMSKLLSPCLRPRHVVIKVGVFIYADLTQVSTPQLKGERPFIFEYLIDNNVLNFAWVENKLIFNLIRTSKLKTVQFTQNIHTKCSWFTQCISMSQTLPTQH